jgi:sRNA-binding protein
MGSDESRRRKRYEKAKVILGTLRERYPLVFQTPPMPLASNIEDQIEEATGCHDRTVISKALRQWMRTHKYLAAVTAGGLRYNLDGSPNGTVSRLARDGAKEAMQELQHHWRDTGREHLIASAEQVAFLARERRRLHWPTPDEDDEYEEPQPH